MLMHELGGFWGGNSWQALRSAALGQPDACKARLLRALPHGVNETTRFIRAVLPRRTRIGDGRAMIGNQGEFSRWLQQYQWRLVL